jgi:hypothetical protein
MQINDAASLGVKALTYLYYSVVLKHVPDLCVGVLQAHGLLGSAVYCADALWHVEASTSLLSFTHSASAIRLQQLESLRHNKP